MPVRKTRLLLALGALALAAAALALVLSFKRPPSLEWAKRLDAQNIEEIELVVMPQSENKRYRALSRDEFAQVVELIHESLGKYVPSPEAMAGGSIVFAIKMTDSTWHRVGNIGNEYLLIDGDYYAPGYRRLAAWDRYGQGNAPLPPDFFQRRLSLEDVLRLSKKGEALRLEDFDGYAYTETGSGLCIRVYETDGPFALWIGGGSTADPPMYIRLAEAGDADTYIDLSTGDAAAFIRRRSPQDHAGRSGPIRNPLPRQLLQPLAVQAPAGF